MPKSACHAKISAPHQNQHGKIRDPKSGCQNQQAKISAAKSACQNQHGVLAHKNQHAKISAARQNPKVSLLRQSQRATPKSVRRAKVSPPQKDSATNRLIHRLRHIDSSINTSTHTKISPPKKDKTSWVYRATLELGWGWCWGWGWVEVVLGLGCG